MVAAVATVWFLLNGVPDSFVGQFNGGGSIAVPGPEGEVTENEVEADPVGDTEAEPTQEIETDEEEAPSEIFTTDFNASGLRATSFDPAGQDGQEHEEAVLRPFDGDPTTFWFTQMYRDRTFGQLKAGLSNPGVGLIVEFEEPRSVEDIEFETSRVDWAFDLYAQDVAPATLEAWGEPIGSFSGLGTSEIVDVEDSNVGALLFWVTDLGVNPEQTPQEYDAEVSAGISQLLRISRIELVG